MRHTARRNVFAALLLGIGSALVGQAQPAQAQSITVPQQAAAIMPVDDIRIGMKGYGMTVFHGTQIEPFNLEVVSIVPNSSPARSIVWVRCTDDRMVESGPVQGMSGSPIYLWDEGETHDLGKGGKLIGAFAFGFAESKQCIIGVQPIEYMRESATRIKPEDPQAEAHPSGPGSVRQTLRLLNNLKLVPGYDEAPALTRTRIDALRELVSRLSGHASQTNEQTPQATRTPGPYSDAYASRLMLPLTVGSVRSAEALAPLLEPMGLMPVAGETLAVAGKPPSGIDPARVTIQPGSVLTVPLVYGDLDLNASGTVTDVLPGGEVLAFGHPMFGTGEAKVPMATGYVHFVMPRNTISFKRSGSLTPVGTLVRDESAAVVGVKGQRYTTAPVEVSVKMSGMEPTIHHYEVVNEPSLSASLIANCILSSIETIHGVPAENTMRLKADLRFTGGHELNMDTLIAGGSSINAIFEVLPIVGVLVQNPYEDLDVESINVSVDIENEIQAIELIGGRLDRAEVAPGDTVRVHLQMQRYGAGVEDRTISFKVPDDLEEGDYPLMISGADTYASLKLSTQPYLMQTQSIEDLIQYIQLTLSFDSDVLYATLQLPDQELAVGRTAMPSLPSSRAAVLTSPTQTDAIPYMRIHEQTYDADTVVFGQVGFTLNVRKR